MTSLLPTSAESALLRLSAALTGFDVAQLTATGLAGEYLKTLTKVVGQDTVHELLALPLEEKALQQAIESQKLGPILLSFIKLWYTGCWYPLPPWWHTTYGGGVDQIHIPSPQAYEEGLVWRAIRAHPTGARPLGFGAWALPPEGPE